MARAADLRDLAAHEPLVAAADDAFGGLYGLVHVAAVIVRRYDIDEVTEDDWDVQHDINLKAAFFLCRAAGRAMVAAGRGGRIITFTSQAWASGGMAGSVVYAGDQGRDRHDVARAGAEPSGRRDHGQQHLAGHGRDADDGMDRHRRCAA